MLKIITQIRYLLVAATIASPLAYAQHSDSIAFFSSNNTGEIDTQTAYQRLTGKPQHQLQKDTIKVLQDNHMEQGEFNEILGTYQMSTDRHITADNTEVFYASPKQVLTDEKAFAVATALAKTLHQDSIAVFIPNKANSVGDLSIKFSGKKPSVNDVIEAINKKLPATYAQAFSLKLTHTQSGIGQAQVSRIEWLGSNIKKAEIKKAFPGGRVTTTAGTAYLVYQNGNAEKI